jgi:predicted negative regulator of RcsB-dependent stress response
MYAMIYSETNQLPAAENILREAINKLPEYHVLLADKLAVVLYLQNKKIQALQLLNEVENAAMSATHIAAKLVFFRLAMLYDESNQISKAKNSFNTFLLETQSNTNQEYHQYQQIAEKYIANH